MDAVAGLMLERQRVEAWIAALEAKRAITPPHVYERVRGDYEKRLREVMAQLAGRSNEVQAAISQLTERLVRMQNEETALREQRHEHELRAAVGEFDPEKWREYLRASDEALARMTRDRSAISNEIARLQQILAMAGPVQGGAGAAASPDGAPRRRSSQETRPPEPLNQSGFDELAFLQSVVDPRDTNGASPPSPSTGGAPPGALSGLPLIPTAPPMPPGRTSGGGPKPPPGRTSAPQQPRSSAPQPRSSVPQPRTSQPPTGPPTPGGIKLPDLSKRQETETGEVPAFLKDVPQEQTRTLKCAQCGAMNFPTEWYCERCGSELAQM